MEIVDELELADAYREAVLKRTKLKPNELICPREKSELTPCIARDGQLALVKTIRGGVCVGCNEFLCKLVNKEIDQIVKEFNIEPISDKEMLQFKSEYSIVTCDICSVTHTSENKLRPSGFRTLWITDNITNKNKAVDICPSCVEKLRKLLT